MNTVIIVAGGSGLRMGSQLRKQYLLLNGIPVLRRTLDVFMAVDSIHQICIVVPESDIDYCRKILPTTTHSGINVQFTPGGRERQESVYNGLMCCHDMNDGDVVLVHDGVRPFVRQQDIQTLIDMAGVSGAAILAVPVLDTLKRVNKDCQICETISRDALWQAQTPQAFHYAILRSAHEKAVRDDFWGTDDAELVERTGVPVSVVEGRRENLKITTPEDILIAEYLASSTSD